MNDLVKKDEPPGRGKKKRPYQEKHWNDWVWQFKNRITTLEQLEKVIHLSPEERSGIENFHRKFSMAITPYFASILDPNNPNCPLRKQVIPRIEESHFSEADLQDPCGEDNHSPVPGLVHRYPDRVLLLVTNRCATYCRYCTRRRIVGNNESSITDENLQGIYTYIRGNRKIRDVLISGGDPLTLHERRLESILQNLKRIPHIELLRIGTRVPVTLPQRINESLLQMLKKYHPLMMSIHFTHPREITPEVKKACEALADAGIPLGSQTVLLKGINDSAVTIKKLMHELLRIRVRPYYIYQCDLAQGTEHLRTPVSTGIHIIEKLRGHTTGYAVPTFVVDAPGGGGKIPLSPNYLLSQSPGEVCLRNYEKKIFKYTEPADPYKKSVEVIGKQCALA
jgi:lysine 2,3-aminomutase